MEQLEKYIINIKGKKNGNYQFSYEINNAFFACFEQTEISDAKLKLKVSLIKKSDMLIFDFDFQGQVQVQCDRCLDYFDVPLSFSETLYVEFAEQSSDITDVDEVMYLAHTAEEINLSQHIFEYVILHLPVRRVHPTDENGNETCNQEMLERLEEHSQQDNDSIDPRWEKLKSMLN